MPVSSGFTHVQTAGFAEGECPVPDGDVIQGTCPEIGVVGLGTQVDVGCPEQRQGTLIVQDNFFPVHVHFFCAF